jgi:hypothetical protein
MNDRDFVDAFENCAIASHDFHHADHVRLAWIYLRERPVNARRQSGSVPDSAKQRGEIK